MTPAKEDVFETGLLEAADVMKKRLYLEAGGKCGNTFELCVTRPSEHRHGISWEAGRFRLPETVEHGRKKYLFLQTHHMHFPKVLLRVG